MNRHYVEELRPDRLAKLPRWAIEHIHQLYMRHAEACADAERAARTGPTHVAVGVQPNRVGDKWTETAQYWADDHATVRFTMQPDALNPRNYIDVRLENDELHIRGSECTQIVPKSSNYFTVTLRKRT